LLPPPRWYTPLTQFLQVVALNHFDAVKHRLRVFSERCTACGLCAAGCPADAITMGANGPLLQTGRCLLCCRCIHACPERAIALGKRLKDNRRIDPALLATLKAQARAALGLSV
jgi:ferredoxin